MCQEYIESKFFDRKSPKTFFPHSATRPSKYFSVHEKEKVAFRKENEKKSTKTADDICICFTSLFGVTPMLYRIRRTI